MNISHRQHLLHAALFWMGIGLTLGFFGVKWVWMGFGVRAALVWLLLCAVVGLLKGEFAMGKAAKKSILRIQNLPDPSPFYQVFSKAQWAVVFGMMFLGMVIRHLPVDKSWRGLVLAAVGIALVWASRYFWKEACSPSR